jgi:DNA invertase Pin-like site-specific DNA recombinase
MALVLPHRHRFADVHSGNFVSSYLVANMALILPMELPDPSAIKRAAQYVRMSTDLQQYSIRNQADAIASYAEKRGLEIVRSYADEGRSGLNIEGRGALRGLIRDVQNGEADFDCILVYDVSRWGRFQDADESAYYEFVCKEAGIQVVYCAEQFENDGSLTSNILKNIKRAMAGEYSRELSTKVFIGQCRVVKLGFWRGGPASYGLRRVLLDETGVRRMQLERGQRKSLQTDRIILTRGPAAERQIVKGIFESFVKRKKTVTEIANELNERGVRPPRGLRWWNRTVDMMLANEIYVGNLVFNRSSFKLQQRHVKNPPEMWIRRDGAVPALIEPKIFAKAQELRKRRITPLTDQEIIDQLVSLWRRKGTLKQEFLLVSNGVPCEATLRRRFGSVNAAFKLAGYEQRPRFLILEHKAKRKNVVRAVATEITERVEAIGGHAVFDDESHFLTINERFTVSIGTAWAHSEGNDKQKRWYVRADKQSVAGIGLILKMDRSNTFVETYLIVSGFELARVNYGELRTSNPVFASAQKHSDLEAFHRICAEMVRVR